ncbi:HNH endonuclease signature motif containing protein [Leucobacter chromiireducens]|uniref:HNH endonuclease signature motif containing protein n=1 Tax=Leucobacter chromiireducens TaxID=283877 RepID=UPI000F643713|nr:HNH endonuclease signature motif containing protein [Leucobacter chromiireducens]
MTATGNFTPTQLARVTDAVRQIDRIERARRALDAERVTVFADALSAVLGGATVGERELAYRSLRLEFATACASSETRVERLLSHAATLTEHFTDTLGALRAGEISFAHARVITAAGAVFVTGDVRADAVRRGGYESEVIAQARQETPARLRPIARAIAAKYAERTVEERHREAVARRSVRVRDFEDGMAELVAFLPAVEAYAIMDRLGRIARNTVQEEAAARHPEADEPRGSEDTVEASGLPHRTRDATRADVLRDLLLSGDTDTSSAPGPAIRAKVQVVVPVEMLIPPEPSDAGAAPVFAALGRRPSTGASGWVAELIGYGPIPAAAASALAAAAPVWEGVTTAPSGDVLTVDRYVPTPEMHRRIAARDLHCRAPGCRAPSTRCDVDHTIASADGGPTSTANLALLCRAHHSLKHHTDWRLTQLPGGVLRWVSPTGRVRLDRPPSRVRFRAAPQTPQTTAEPRADSDPPHPF